MKRSTVLESPAVTLRIEASDDDLTPYREAWQAHRRAGSERTVETVLESYRALDPMSLLPAIRSRLQDIPALVRMLADPQWNCSLAAREDLQAALNYFADPNDVIPDDSPHFGLLDDALVIEMALVAQQDEWSAWQEFDLCRKSGVQVVDGLPMTRMRWLGEREHWLDSALRHSHQPDFAVASPIDGLHRERHSYLGRTRDDESSFHVL